MARSLDTEASLSMRVELGDDSVLASLGSASAFAAAPRSSVRLPSDAFEGVGELDVQTEKERYTGGEAPRLAVHWSAALGRATPQPHTDYSIPEFADFAEFRDHERRMRARNRTRAAWATGTQPDEAACSTSGCEVAGGNELFLSHSWRSALPTQKRKWQLIGALSSMPASSEPRAFGESSLAGMTYWADYLDLHAEGPVKWREEIFRGIRCSAKVVCFIDGEYLKSFNCLQELACAVHHSKPLVPVIMDQAAWHLLTTPRGAEEVLQDPGCGLADYLGRPLLEGQPLSEDALRELYWQLSAINFCPCRQEDVASMGVVEVVRNLQTYIGKDIPYLKEYAELDRRARDWAARGEPIAALLPREEMWKWKAWAKMANRHGQRPPPNAVQAAYVAASERRCTFKKLAGWALAAVVGALLLASVVFAGVMWDRAARQRGACGT